jgi:16S rRNA (adenine1518-N6/adenine1519-N6)-dimethyltransferase
LKLNYNSARELRAFLDENNLGMRKKFGQNFLINPAVRQAMADALDAGEGESVWEIGPGLGAMTSLLLDKGLHVRAFEIDSGFIRVLKKLFADNPRFTLAEGDVLKTWPQQPAAKFLLANLPYNIAATLLGNFIEQGKVFQRMVVTVQREVARRMSAAPASADYSSFSVLCASVYRIQPLMVIKSGSFYPKPRVDSQAVLLEAKEDFRALPRCFYPLLRHLFSSRRKTIKNNLINFFALQNGNPEQIAAHALEKYAAHTLEKCAAHILEKCAIDGRNRAENLSLDHFTALAKTVEDMGILHKANVNRG